jgi:hypothetical protein
MGEKQEFEKMKQSPGAMDLEQSQKPPLYKRRKCKICSCICLIVIISLAIVAIALSQTIFKFRDPKTTLENTKLQNVSLNFDLSSLSTLIDISISTDVRVDNPNYYDFRYSDSKLSMVYHGSDVGVIELGAGTIRSRKTVDLHAVITVQALKLVINALQDIASGVATLGINSVIEGRINLAKIYKKHVTVTLSCDVEVFFGECYCEVAGL